MANFDTLIPALTGNQCSEETASERVASAISINDLIVLQNGHWEGLGFIRLCGANQNSRLGTVCEHHDARPGSILFFYQSDCLCDSGEVLRAGEAVRVRPRFGFGLVAKDEITVREDFPQLFIEELEKKRSGEVESENLLLG